MVEAGYRPDIVLTQPDRPAGRGRKVQQSAAKQVALAHELNVAQPQSLKDAALIKSLGLDQLDILIVAAYGLLLPQAVLDAPRRGCVNIHASLLPRWRGAAPIVWAIAEGDSQTGVCLMQMEAGLDTGPVLASAALPIGAQDTSVEVHDQLARLGADLLLEKMTALLAGDLAAVPQDDTQATHARKLSRSDGEIDWSMSSGEIDRRIRAFNPYPGCVTDLDGERLKLWRSRLVNGTSDAPAGTIIEVGEHGMQVACQSGIIEISEVQRPGKQRITPLALDHQLPLHGLRLGNFQ